MKTAKPIAALVADGLHVRHRSSGLGDRGVYLSQMPNLMFLKNTEMATIAAIAAETIMHGFDTADSHPLSHLYLGPGRRWQEGTFHYINRDSVRPASMQRGRRLFAGSRGGMGSSMCSCRMASQPAKGARYIDRWGQNFVADGLRRSQLLRHSFFWPDPSSPEATAALKQFSMQVAAQLETVPTTVTSPTMRGRLSVGNNDIAALNVLRYRVQEDEAGLFRCWVSRHEIVRLKLPPRPPAVRA